MVARCSRSRFRRRRRSKEMRNRKRPQKRPDGEDELAGLLLLGVLGQRLNELIWIERLGEIIIRAAIPPSLLFFFAAERAQNDDRDVVQQRVFAQLQAD